MKKGILFCILSFFYATIQAQNTTNISKNSSAAKTEMAKENNVKASAQLIPTEDYTLVQKKEKSIVVLGNNLQTKRITIEAQAQCITPDEKETYNPPKREAVRLSPEKQSDPKKTTKTVIVPPVELIPKK